MPALEAGYKAALALIGALKGGEKATDPGSSVTQQIEGGLSAGSGITGAVGSLLGATTPAGVGAGTALLGSGIGGGLMAASGILGAGAAGFWVGNLLDKQFGLSDKLSDAMSGLGQDDLLLRGVIGMGHPGLPTPAEQAAAAARLPLLEARRQQEIASLSEMWTDGSATPWNGMNQAMAGTVLEDKYGIDMERIHGDEDRKREAEAKTPAARMQREAARQVQLSNHIQARAATSLPMFQSVEDARIGQILGHYGD